MKLKTFKQFITESIPKDKEQDIYNFISKVSLTKDDDEMIESLIKNFSISRQEAIRICNKKLRNFSIKE